MQIRCGSCYFAVWVWSRDYLCDPGTAEVLRPTELHLMGSPDPSELHLNHS